MGTRAGGSRFSVGETMKRGARETMRAWCSCPLLLLALTAAAPPQAPAPRPPPEQPRARIWREPPGAMENGRFGMPVAGNLHVGLGRFSGSEMTRSTHTEPIGRSGDIVRRERGRAAVGISLRF
jgi:hypothetical protein